MITGNPLDTAYNRLDEAHRAWHLALQGYHKINDFRAGVNSAIQAFRNLTFSLQKQKDNLTNFDEWYGGWQMKMKNDDILKELHNARSVIVHQEDLSLKSKAIAKIKGWTDLESTAFEFNPMKDSHEVARGFYDTFARYLPIPQEIKKRLLFDFEREWIYEKLPNCELLEALAHSYHFFYKMLNDAQQKFSLPPKNNYATGDYCNGHSLSNKKLKCMAITKQERSLIFSLEDGQTYNVELAEVNPDKVSMEKAIERYGKEWESEENASLIEGVFENEYPFSIVKTFARVAMANLKKDKYLIPMSFIFTKQNKAPIMISHTFKNQEEKLISINLVADEIVKNEGNFVLHIAEAWQAKFDKNNPDEPAYKKKDKKEILHITCLSSDSGRNVIIPFHKNVLGQITFSKPIVDNFLTTEEHLYHIFLPVIQSLRKVKSKE